MAKHNIKAYVFDLGNVIVDVRFDRFLPILGLDGSLTADETIRMFRESGITIQYERGAITTDEFVERSMKLLQINREHEKFIEAWNSIIGEEDKAIARLIKSLAKKNPVYLLSNTNPLHFGQARRNASSLDHLKAYFLSYEFKLLKPDPKIYLKVAKKIGIRPEHIFFVDDREDNVASANDTGFIAVRHEGAKKLREIIRKL